LTSVCKAAVKVVRERATAYSAAILISKSPDALTVE
jgi:hypothetical protein